MEEQDQVFGKIKTLLGEVIGQDFIEEYDLSMDTILTNDLEMESIEIVELSEKIKKSFGKEIGISDWMAKMTLEELVDLSIGDIVNFIEECKQLK